MNYQPKTNICWGADQRWAVLPISNVPSGVLKIRRRVRSKDVARAYLKFKDRIENWYLEQDGKDSVKLWILKGVNTLG